MVALFSWGLVLRKTGVCVNRTTTTLSVCLWTLHTVFEWHSTFTRRLYHHHHFCSHQTGNSPPSLLPNSSTLLKIESENRNSRRRCCVCRGRQRVRRVGERERERPRFCASSKNRDCEKLKIDRINMAAPALANQSITEQATRGRQKKKNHYYHLKTKE